MADHPSIMPRVVPQNHNIPPPTRKPPKKPVSAQSRATTLLRQIQRPHKHVVDKKAPPKPNAHSNLDTNKRGSPRRKKPYKSLEVKTVDTPHVYMTRAASPAPPHKPLPRKPPTHNPPRTTSREKLLLTHTTSDGYVIPETRIGSGDDVHGQQLYQEIEAEARDSVALYTVPLHHTTSDLSITEQPIYEEPRPN